MGNGPLDNFAPNKKAFTTKKKNSMKQQFLFALACTALIAGCKTDNPGPSAPPSGTKYLERAVTTEDGQSVTYHLAYDDKNRLIAYNSAEENYRSKITYDGKSNPVKFELESDGAKQVFEITYNNAGIPVSALSSLTNPETPNKTMETGITYEVANGKVNKMVFTDEAGNKAIYSLSYVGNNLTRVAYAADEGELVLTWKYGNKKSAYVGARFNYLVIPDLFSVFSNENEITESKLEIPGLGSVTSTYTYQFDAAGYPTSVTEKDQDGNESKTVFHYR